MMSLPKSWPLASFLRGVLEEQLVHHVGVEDVDPHRRQGQLGMVGHGGRVGGLLDEAGDPPAAVDPHHAEPLGLGPRHGQAGDRQVGPVVAVGVDHPRIVHLVDMIARQDDRVAGGRLLDRVDVLVDGVGRPLVPHLGDPLLGRDHLDVFPQLAAEELPPHVDVPVQAGGLVLGQHQDLAEVGIDAIREGEVDDPVDPAEGDRGLGPVPREGLEAGPPASRQDDRQDVAIHHPPPLCRPRFLSRRPDQGIPGSTIHVTRFPAIPTCAGPGREIKQVAEPPAFPYNALPGPAPRRRDLLSQHHDEPPARRPK